MAASFPFRTAPAIEYSLIKDSDTRTPTNQVVYHGYQPSGRYLNLIDLDNHTDQQDAAAAKAACETRFTKISWHPSEGKRGRPGWHGYVLTNKPLPHGKIYDQAGRHIGELLSTDESFSIMPADMRPGWLSATEYDLIVRFWNFQGSIGRDGGNWRGKASEGAKIAGRYMAHRIKKDMLRAFLQAHCGEPGAHLDALFDSRKLFNRSDAAGSLMQCLMFHIHKLLPMGGYSERCALAMAYWMAAESYGKSDNYDQETDGYALIEKIVNERPREGGGHWRAPFWAKAHPTPIAAPEAPPAPPTKPAHRPVGDKEKHLAIFRRVLEAIEPDDFGRRTYTLEYLSERTRAARRTIQAYLKKLRDDGEIVTAQIGGNRRPYAVLTSCFGGANKSKIAPESALKPSHFGGANRSPAERIATPQTAQSNAPTVVDHLNLGAPPVGYDAAGRRLGLTDLVREALDLCKRPSLKRVRTYVRMNAANPEAYNDAGIALVYRRELKKRQYETRDAKLAEKARNLRADVLKRKAKSTAGQAAQLDRAASPQAPVWRRMAGIYAAEEQRRQPEDVPTTHELWAEVDMDAYNQAHRQLKKHAGLVAAAPVGAQDLGALPRSGPQAAEVPRPGTLGSLLAGIQQYHQRQAGAP